MRQKAAYGGHHLELEILNLVMTKFPYGHGARWSLTNCCPTRTASTSQLLTVGMRGDDALGREGSTSQKIRTSHRRRSLVAAMARQMKGEDAKKARKVLEGRRRSRQGREVLKARGRGRGRPFILDEEAVGEAAFRDAEGEEKKRGAGPRPKPAQRT